MYTQPQKCSDFQSHRAVRVSFYLYYENYVYDDATASKITPVLVGSHSHLAGLEEVKANVGVACGRIDAVVTEVLTDVFWCGLWQ